MAHKAKLNTQYQKIKQLLTSLDSMVDQDQVEAAIRQTFSSAPVQLIPTSNDYYSVLNACLYKYILKHYKYGETRICLWRYFKALSADQLNYRHETSPELQIVDHLVRIYFYSDPLDDLTCLFVPVETQDTIGNYLDWIKSYFYEANYPTSLLWLYALDSSLASLFPDEIIFLGRGKESSDDDIIMPDFGDSDTVLLKRYSSDQEHYVKLTGENANSEFRQIFTFLQREYRDRCLSHSTNQSHNSSHAYRTEWKKFEDVLRFGVSDLPEGGCISFSDLRASTEFLNTFGKSVFLNKIQQPFFEMTKLISRKYEGRIDKFMGDNVMCVFLDNNMQAVTPAQKEREALLKNLFAVFMLCKVLYQIISRDGFIHSNLGLRSGVTYGSQILRSNLGNEIVRDFTVTGETVNLAARLEHISMRELIIHNQNYFKEAIDRFPEIRSLLSISGNFNNLNPETQAIIQDYTVYQNILSNLETLEKVRFDVRFNGEYYQRLRDHLLEKGYQWLNADTAVMHGYEQFSVEGFDLYFYYSYYNPKGFNQYEKIWIMPLEINVLQNLEIDLIA